MSGGNVILNNSEIQELVEISMLLGCTADMIKEPKVFICFLIFYGSYIHWSYSLGLYVLVATVLEEEASKVKEGSGGGGAGWRLNSILMDPLRAYTRSYIVKEIHIGYKQIDPCHRLPVTFI